MRRKTRRTDERGAVMILAVGGVVLAMISAALAVDLGRLAQDKRFDQKVADMAALDASRDLTQACARAKDSVLRNTDPLDPLELVCMDPANNAADDVVIGRWTSGRFVADPLGNAVQVTARSPFKPAFPFVGGVDRTQADAVASNAPQATFRVGSTLATVTSSQATLLNGILSTLAAPSTVNLTALGYNGLATQSVSLTALQTQLLALGNDVGTTDQLLNSDIEVADLLTATANALNAPGSTAADQAAAATINGLPIATIPALKTVKLGQLFSLEQPSDDAALATGINVFDLVTGSAILANGTNALAIPTVGITLPLGITSLTISATLVEGPQYKTGSVGASVDTRQALVTLNLGVLAGLSVANVAITLSAADATATLTGIRCDTVPPGIDLNVKTSALSTSVAATLLGSPLSISAPDTGGANENLSFDYPAGFGVENAQTVGATGLGIRPTFTGSGLLGGLVAGALNLTLGTLGLWNTISAVLDPLFQSLGINIGAADVAAIAMLPPPPSCGQPRLVG